MHVGIGGAEQHAVLGQKHAVAVEKKTQGKAQEIERHQDAEVALHNALYREELSEKNNAAPEEVEQRRQESGKYDQAAHHRVHGVEEGILEEIERDVFPEERIGKTGRPAVQEKERL